MLRSYPLFHYQNIVRVLYRTKVSQDWLWYAGMKGNNAIASWRASGAYIFRPDGIPHLFTDKVKINGIYDGLYLYNLLTVIDRFK